MKQISVLIVEDEEVVRESIARFLQRQNIRTLTADGGNSALAMLRQQSVDLVVADVQMPNGDGLSLLSRMASEITPLPKIILMTGHTDRAPEVAAKYASLTLLQKPFRPEALVHLIENLFCD